MGASARMRDRETAPILTTARDTAAGTAPTVRRGAEEPTVTWHVVRFGFTSVTDLPV